jgi:hypothetical protein
MAGGTFELYRAEAWGVLQGKMQHPGVMERVSKGPCPKDVDANIYKDRTCYDHDPDCGCHGASIFCAASHHRSPGRNLVTLYCSWGDIFHTP